MAVPMDLAEAEADPMLQAALAESFAAASAASGHEVAEFAHRALSGASATSDAARTVSGVSSGSGSGASVSGMSEDDEWGEDEYSGAAGESESVAFDDESQVTAARPGASSAATGRGVVLDNEGLSAKLNEAVSGLAAVTGLPDCDCYRLLSSARWDIDAAAALVYKDGGQAEIQKVVGCRHPDDVEGAAVTECMICFDELDTETGEVTPCGHVQCPTCVPEHVKVLVREGGRGTIECPMFRCTRRLPFDLIYKCLADEPILMESHKKSQRDEFVLTHPGIVYCPAPDCTLAVAVPTRAIIPSDRGCTVVTCGGDCGKRFCFSCSADVHVPTSCKLMKLWLDKINCDAASLGWITSQTKECPFCKSPVQKDGGCNSVSCRCGKEFCWLCLTSHNNHSFGEGASACNRYKPDAKTTFSDYRENVKRYLHYLERFENHKNGMKLQEGKFEQAKDSVITGLTPLCGSESANEAMATARETMSVCRQTLSSTYAFAYFLEPSSQQVIFEQNQEDLETHLELLTRMIEAEDDLQLALVDPKAYHEKLIRWTAYCEKRAEVLLEHCAEGYERREWKFVDDALAIVS